MAPDETTTAETLVPAGFWARFAATIVDAMIVGAMSLPFSLTAQYFFGPGGTGIEGFSGRDIALWFVAVVLASLFAMAVQFGYYAIFYKAQGATPGKRLLGIEVIKQSSGAYLTPSETFLREIVGKMLSGLTLGIGYLMAGLRSDKLALHDLISGSRVVVSPRARKPDLISTTPASTPGVSGLGAGDPPPS